MHKFITQIGLEVEVVAISCKELVAIVHFVFSECCYCHLAWCHPPFSSHLACEADGSAGYLLPLLWVPVLSWILSAGIICPHFVVVVVVVVVYMVVYILYVLLLYLELVRKK